MADSKSDSSDGCFLWFIIIMLILGQCDQNSRLDKLENNAKRIEATK